VGKRRLDLLLIERGLFPSRSRAAASIMAGEVRVGVGGRRASKPGELIDAEASVRVLPRPQYVSRGGIKLANALASSGLQVRDRLALDVGASTGGFSDCLLKHGAAAVTAVDVAYGALAWGLRVDPRVHVLERTNARSLTPQMLPFVPDLAVLDVSFISLRKVLGAVLACLAPRYDALALVKPQFELSRERVGKGGVVRDGAHRREALIGVGEAALALGAAVRGFHPSGLAGPKGNRETFIWLSDPSTAPSPPRAVAAGADAAGASEALEAMAREAEP
jgi:23S rRNA (cytidine1920-2'-O)/16S rRNA (cytidine1409-2'-O)-methyltransferase